MAYCPTCGVEYGPESESCDICKGRLVDSLSRSAAPIENGETDLMELAEFSNVSEAEMIREILEKNEIMTVLRGESDPLGIASGAEAITLLVEKRSIVQARELYEAYFAGSGTEEMQLDDEEDAANSGAE